MSGEAPALLADRGRKALATRVRARVDSSQVREAAPQPAAAGRRRAAASCELVHGHTIASPAGAAAPHGETLTGSSGGSSRNNSNRDNGSSSSCTLDLEGQPHIPQDSIDHNITVPDMDEDEAEELEQHSS